MLFKNSNLQGNAGIGSAIAWFTARGYLVSIPLTDTQAYDLVVDQGDGALFKVQVKTVYCKNPAGRYYARTATKGGNRSGSGKIQKLVKAKDLLLFVLTAEGNQYLIPTLRIHTNGEGIVLGEKYLKYKVNGGGTRFRT